MKAHKYVIIRPPRCYSSKRLKASDYYEQQLQKYKENEKRLTQENENLKSKLKETKEKLEFNKEELCCYKDTQKVLKAQLEKCYETVKNMKCVEVQTDPILCYSKSEDNPPPAFISSGDQQSSPFIEHNPRSDDETGSDEQETYTKTVMTKIVIRRETVPTILADNELNVNDLSQTYKENRFMPGFLPTFMPSVTSSNIATSVPPFLPFIVPTQGPVFLNSENSASYLSASMQETNSNNK